MSNLLNKIYDKIFNDISRKDISEWTDEDYMLLVEYGVKSLYGMNIVDDIELPKKLISIVKRSRNLLMYQKYISTNDLNCLKYIEESI